MSNVSQQIDAGVRLHQAGQLDEAAAIYRQVLAVDPGQADAWNLLGLVLRQQGQFAASAEHLQRALQLDQSQAAYFANLAEAYRGLDRFDEAIALYQKAVQLQPAAGFPHARLGLLYEQTRQYPLAAASYLRAIQLEPDQVDVRVRLGQVYQHLGQLADAAAQLEHVVTAGGESVEALAILGSVRRAGGNLAGALVCYEQAIPLRPNEPALHFELGNVLHEIGRHGAAAEAYRVALTLKPDYAQAACNLGNSLREQGQPEAALVELERAVALDPRMPAALNNLAVALQDLGRFDEAQARFEQAVALDPTRAELHFNLGTVLRDQANVDQALVCYERALQLNPSYRQVVCSRAMVYLSQGDFARGWRDYEARIGLPQFDTYQLPGARWDGTPLGDRRLLVHSEQGLGDTIQFLRFLPLVAERAPQVTVAVPGRLLPLLRNSGYTNLVPREEVLPAYDAHIPLMSLPLVLGTTLDNLPNTMPYVSPDRERTNYWSQRLMEFPGIRIGIAWQGRRNFRGDRQRSIPLAAFAPLAQVPDVQLISLQQGPGCEQLAELGGDFVVHAFDDLDGPRGAFVDTAALIETVHLVITSDTAVAHLAGALGAPVWVALNRAPDWRWMRDRADSPWYPNMQLFRQRVAGDWFEVFTRMADEIRATPGALSI